MCLLIGQSTNSKVSNKKLGNAWCKNNDGVGYAFANNGKIETKKFMEFKPFKKSFNDDVAKYGNESSFLIHFRFATHGKTDLSNVHPFSVNDDLVFGHNGVIHEVDSDVKLSDTQVFNNLILKDLNSKFLKSDSIRALISNFIGNSKLCFLDSNGNLDFINADLGHWDDAKKIWYSNDGYKKQKSVFVSGGAFNHQRWDNVNNCYVGNFGFNTEKKSKKSNVKTVKNGIKDYTKKYANNEWLICDYCHAETDNLTRYNYQEICKDCLSSSEGSLI